MFAHGKIRKSFNSTLVQLKVIASLKYSNLLKKFQFYLSSIKSGAGAFGLHGQNMCFNSTLVQLKVIVSFIQLSPAYCFNSTLVQLKAG